MAAMGGGAFKRTPATLILRDVSVPPDDSLETLTPFMPPSVPDPDAVLVEAKGLLSHHPCLSESSVSLTLSPLCHRRQCRPQRSLARRCCCTLTATSRRCCAS